MARTPSNGARQTTETANQRAARLQKELDDLRQEVKELWSEYSPDWCGDKMEVAERLRKHGANVGYGTVQVKLVIHVENPDPTKITPNDYGGRLFLSADTHNELATVLKRTFGGDAASIYDSEAEIYE